MSRRLSPMLLFFQNYSSKVRYHSFKVINFFLSVEDLFSVWKKHIIRLNYKCRSIHVSMRFVSLPFTQAVQIVYNAVLNIAIDLDL